MKYDDGLGVKGPLKVTVASYTSDRIEFRHLSRQASKDNGFLAKTLRSYLYHVDCEYFREPNTEKFDYEIRHAFLGNFEGDFGAVMVSNTVHSRKKIKFEVSPD